MYDVLVYDEERSQYVPAKDGVGRRMSYPNWNLAAGAAIQFTLNDPSQQYKVEYRHIRRPKGRKVSI